MAIWFMANQTGIEYCYSQQIVEWAIPVETEYAENGYQSFNEPVLIQTGG